MWHFLAVKMSQDTGMQDYFFPPKMNKSPFFRGVILKYLSKIYTCDAFMQQVSNLNIQGELSITTEKQISLVLKVVYPLI